MKRPTLAILIGASLLLAAAKVDPFAAVSPQDKPILQPAIQRYASDQMKLDWNDLFEIDEQDVATKRDFLLRDDAPPVGKSDYVTLKNQAVESGGNPVMTSFEITSVAAQKDGFLIEACAASKRETFRFKGIIQFQAHIHDGKATFGSWRYEYLMPHSCSQTKDTE